MGPAGTTATPRCALQDSSTGDKYCALTCFLGGCPAGAKCEHVGLTGICMYPDSDEIPAKHLTLSSQLKNRLPSEQAIVPFCGCQPGHATASMLASPQRLARNSLWGCFRTVFCRGTFASA